MNYQAHVFGRLGRAWLILVAGSALVVLALALLAGGAGAQTGSFANPAFQRVWERTDFSVGQGKVSRTWIWGPTAGAAMQEAFAEGPGGQHLVQYFDKARMEINNPNGNPADPYYVTNGLLVVEMISGRVQTGANTFEQRPANTVPVAGDDNSAPSYAVLQSVASVGLNGKPNRTDPVTNGNPMPPEVMSANGTITLSGASYLPIIKSAAYISETGHNIPDVFWNYLNAQGPIYENGSYRGGQLFNWISAMGYPVSEPYWTSISVGGQPRTILFQAFQRRILTYSPGNPQGWQVEMGNVGAQYYKWRYETAAQPTPTATSATVACQRVPVRGFGRVWADNAQVKQGIGCPLQYAPFDKELAIATAYQPFQHGTMLWISRTTYVQEKFIEVLFDDGTFQQFDDTWREGDPVSSGLTPPSGLYEPVRGFGKVWREGTGARVRERLGWATAAEKGGTGAYQRFDRGEMYWSSAVNKIWVLYGTVSGPYPAPTPPAGVAVPPKYEVYNDTFAP